MANTKSSRSQLSLDFNDNAVADLEERTNLHEIIVRRKWVLNQLELTYQIDY